MIWSFILGWFGGFIGCALLLGYLARHIEIRKVGEGEESGGEDGGVLDMDRKAGE